MVTALESGQSAMAVLGMWVHMALVLSPGLHFLLTQPRRGAEYSGGPRGALMHPEMITARHSTYLPPGMVTCSLPLFLSPALLPLSRENSRTHPPVKGAGPHRYPTSPAESPVTRSRSSV